MSAPNTNVGLLRLFYTARSTNVINATPTRSAKEGTAGIPSVLMKAMKALCGVVLRENVKSALRIASVLRKNVGTENAFSAQTTNVFIRAFVTTNCQ